MAKQSIPTLSFLLLLVTGAALLCCAFPGCAAAGGSGGFTARLPATSPTLSGLRLTNSTTFLALPGEKDEAKEEKAAEGEKESSTLGVVALYIPNRIFDLFDMVRFGVNVGPGMGLDARVTKWAKLQLISDTSVGLGLQSLRHLPICARSQTKLGIGFLSTPSMDMLNWYYGDYDVRLELYLFLVGAHVAVDLGEIVDFIGGIFTWDPMDDDFQADL